MTHADLARKATRERLSTIGWGLVVLLIGVLALPSGTGEYLAACAVGLLMLAFNVVLYAVSRRVDVFTAALGATALAAGLGALAGVAIDAFALFFIVLGSILVAVPAIHLASARVHADGGAVTG